MSIALTIFVQRRWRRIRQRDRRRARRVNITRAREKSALRRKEWPVVLKKIEQGRQSQQFSIRTVGHQIT